MNRRWVLIAITSIFTSCFTRKAVAENKQPRLILELEDGQTLIYSLSKNINIVQCLTDEEIKSGMRPYEIKIRNGRVYHPPIKTRVTT